MFVFEPHATCNPQSDGEQPTEPPCNQTSAMQGQQKDFANASWGNNGVGPLSDLWTNAR